MEVISTILFGNDVQRKKITICFTLGKVISQDYFYQDLMLKIDQWLCLLELHGIVPSQTTEQYAVVANGKQKIGIHCGKCFQLFTTRINLITTSSHNSMALISC